MPSDDRLLASFDARPAAAGIPLSPTRAETLPAIASVSDLVSVKRARRTAQVFYDVNAAKGWGPGVNRRRPAKQLRHFAERNEWVRVAIERRKHQISQARWHVARVDDPQKPPSKRVVNRVNELLLRFVNPKRESFRSLLDMILEDVLVLDAGCIEKERTLGGSVYALYAIDGATITPDPAWDGSDHEAIRYRQYIDNVLQAEFRNQDLIYVMTSPRTNSAIGWSKVETLMRVIEAELYGEEYDYDMLKQTAPAGALDLGGGLDEETIERFREYYDNEVSGTRNVAIVGGSDTGVKFVPFQRSNVEMQRQEYKKWLATKIAAVFEMDLGVFNLTEAIHKSIGEKQQATTDEGHRALGSTVEEFFTREYVWEIDENHCFRFSDLNARDAASQSNLDKTYVALGALTPNEIRRRDGMGEDLPWGDLPFIPGKGPWTGTSVEGKQPTDEGNPDLFGGVGDDATDENGDAKPAGSGGDADDDEE